MSYRLLLSSASVGAALSLMVAVPAQAGGPVFLSNVVVDGSLCVGLDCPAAPAFGFDTIILRENNLRLFYDDTSVAAAFPSNDWRVYANDSANGGSSYYGVEDATAGRFVFRVFAGARSNALTVDSQGDVGLGTTTPALDIDIKTGDSPSIRLQQDGTSGFTPQSWDIAGNETNFFIRDATHGSKLPFRIRPDAPGNSIFVDVDGDIGFGTASPDADLEISTTETFTFFRLTATGAAVDSADVTYTNGGGGEIRYNIVDGDGEEMSLDLDGNLEVTGNIVSGGGGTCDPGPCDAVFDPAVYTVPSIEDHAAFMWENKRLPALDPTLPGQSFNMTLKVTRMLNELEHAHIYIEQLNDAMKAQSEEIAVLKAKIGTLTAD